MRYRNFKARAHTRHIPGEMNSTERAYAAHLEQQKFAGLIVDYAFEALKLRLADSTFYTIDFMVTTAAGYIECHEVKGSWHAPHQEDSKVKIKVAAAMFWQFRFVSAVPRKKKLGGGWEIEEW